VTQTGQLRQASFEQTAIGRQGEDTPIGKVEWYPVDESPLDEPAAALLEQAPKAADGVGTILCRIHVLTRSMLDPFDNPPMTNEEICRTSGAHVRRGRERSIECGESADYWPAVGVSIPDAKSVVAFGDSPPAVRKNDVWSCA
jgi:hypothetical protein